MAYKSPYQSFQTSWQKTVNWAHSQGIPQSSIYPVYQLDSSRMLSSGYQMSEAERTRAILASANPNNVTPLPTDQPAGGIGGFFGNLEHDASNIFTGLQPTHLVSSIFDSVKNTVLHPNWLFDPTKNTLAQMIPGVSLIGEFEQGGIDNVFKHPLISFLNVLGVASAGTGLIAHTALGDTLAASLDVGSKEALARMGPTGILSKMIGRVPTKAQGLTMGPDGLPTFGNLTVAQRLKNWSGTKGLGSDLSKLNATIAKSARVSGSKLEQLISDGTKANAKLADKSLTIGSDAEGELYGGLHAGDQLDYVHAAYNLAVFSGKSWSELANIDSIPAEIKAMMPHYEAAEEWIQEQNLATGQLTKLRLPDGTYGVYSATEAKPIQSAEAAVTAAEKKADKLMSDNDRLADEIQANDTVAKPAFDALARIGGLAKSTLGEQVLGTTDEVGIRNPGVSRASVARLLGTTPNRVTMTQARMVRDVFASGGLVEQIAAAYQREDFVAFRDLSLKMVKKLRGTTLRGEQPSAMGAKIPSQFLTQAKTVADNLYSYAKSRQVAERQLKKGLESKELAKALAQHEKAIKAYEKAVWRRPAAAWQPLLVRLVNNKIAEDERSAVAIETALSGLQDTGKVADDTLKQLREDPGRVIDILRTYLKAGHEAPFGATLEPGLIEEMQNSARNEIESLRAQGFTPHYVPNFSSRDSLGAFDPSEVGREIHLNPTRYMTPDSVRERMLDQTNTIYDIYAGQTRAMSQRIQSDSVQSLIDDYLIPAHGYKQSDLIKMISAENPLLGGEANIATNQAYLANILENTYDLARFDPTAYGVAGSRHLINDADAVWMPKTLVKGLHDIVTKSELESTGVVSKATNIFRTSVLGYSPRFVAHILFGGSFLVALREPASFLRMGEALKMLQDPDFRAAIHTRSTQVGKDDPIALGVRSFHHETGKTMGRLWAQEMMDKLGLDPSKMTSWLKVIPQLTFKLTNTITDMQRAQVVLSGIHSAERKGWVLDEAGNKVEMTADRALEEGIRRANKVMGDLSHATPLERNVITTVVPFYGWTKHILQYVATYPVDHPYRAMFLANLANMNSDEVSKGLYTRIQNLFFLGAPDQEGNVSAIDVRALNPLRDVANYATIGGLISMLNPVISAPFAMVDPEIVFGSNTLYPNLTYNQLYGTISGAPSGNALTVAEQFVPEVTSIDAALGLSAQYRSLAKSNPNSFAKTIFSALNIPFAQVQHLNLKQIAALQEIDRYRSASAAAQSAFQSGNFSSLSGYGEVPDPLQVDYNISPAALQALYNSTLKEAGGLPPADVLAPLPAPPGL